ncbi:MAG: HD domain-containing protein [Planctomycetes bacterium]|nr:HD domain-containing protein [Planctomycetota bacterium]
MLAAGATLTPAAIQRLAQAGYRDIYVFEEAAAGVDGRDLVIEAARSPMARKLGAFFKSVHDTIGRAAQIGSGDDAATVTDKLGHPDVRKAVKALRFAEVMAGPELDAFYDGIALEKDAPMVTGMPRTDASHHVDHALNVAARSVMIARRLGWAPRECRELCIGALLHDVGYQVLPDEAVKAAPGQQLHPSAGYHLLRADTGISLLCAHCAFQHHERFDGRGFPRRLVGMNTLSARDSTGPGSMHRYASVVAIADVFDLLTSGFPDGWAMRDDEAIKLMRNESGKALHPDALKAFLALTPPYPVGLEVEVLDGEWIGCTGIVASVTAGSMDRPAIKVLRSGGAPLPKAVDIDLAKTEINFRPRGAGER